MAKKNDGVETTLLAFKIPVADAELLRNALKVRAAALGVDMGEAIIGILERELAAEIRLIKRTRKQAERSETEGSDEQ